MSNTCSMFPRNMGVDHCIGELVEKMNEAGLETVASCCGHGFQPTRISLKNGAEILILNYEQAQRVSKLFPDTNGMTRHRGHRIEKLDGSWYYAGTDDLVSEEKDRPCGYCKLANTPEGHDGCLGTLPSVMNACCGHGNPDEAYVQYDNGDRIGGVEALYAALQMKAESAPPPRPTATGGITEGLLELELELIWCKRNHEAQRKGSHQAYFHEGSVKATKRAIDILAALIERAEPATGGITEANGLRIALENERKCLIDQVNASVDFLLASPALIERAGEEGE